MKFRSDTIAKPSEVAMITAGVLMLISVAVITLNGTFNVWYASKALYVAGASLILLGR